jgi:hypothetical protein
MLNLEVVTDERTKTLSTVDKDTNTTYLAASYCPELDEVQVYHSEDNEPKTAEIFLQLMYMYIYCIEEARDRWGSKNDTAIEERISHNGNLVKVHRENGIDKKVEIRSQYSGRPIKIIYRYQNRSVIHLFDGKKNSPEKIVSVNERGEKRVYKMSKGGYVNA